MFFDSFDCLSGFPFLSWFRNFFLEFLQMNLFLVFVCSYTFMFNGAMNIAVCKYMGNCHLLTIMTDT